MSLTDSFLVLSHNQWTKEDNPTALPSDHMRKNCTENTGRFSGGEDSLTFSFFIFFWCRSTRLSFLFSDYNKIKASLKDLKPIGATVQWAETDGRFQKCVTLTSIKLSFFDSGTQSSCSTDLLSLRLVGGVGARNYVKSSLLQRALRMTRVTLRTFRS